MSENNGVVRIGRKGRKKFAFGEEGAGEILFEVDVVVAFQEWRNVDAAFRDRTEDDTIARADIEEYHRAVVAFACKCADIKQPDPNEHPEGKDTPIITTAEALDFLARLREQYDEVADFFQPRSREKRDSPDSTE